MPLGGHLERAYGPRVAIFGGGLVFVVSVAMASLAKSLLGLVLTFGCGFGVGVGMVYVAPIVCGYRWVPNNKGLVSGVVVGGFGGGAFVFNYIATAIVNPNGDSLPSGESYYDCTVTDVCDNVPRMFVTLAVCFAALITVGGLLVNEPPDDRETGAEVERPAAALAAASAREKAVPLPQRPVVALVIFAFVTCALSGALTAATYKTFGSIFFHSDSFLVSVGAAASVCNCLGRFFWGSLGDKVGFDKSLPLMAACNTSLLLTYTFAAEGGELMYTVWTCGLFFCYGGNFATFPTIVARFDPENPGTSYGIVFVFYGTMGAILLYVVDGLVAGSALNVALGGINAVGVIVALALAAALRREGQRESMSYEGAARALLDHDGDLESSKEEVF